MKINQIIINETSAGATGSGSVATVSSPLGKTMSRNSSIYGDKKVGNLLKGKKTSKPYANSLSEGRMGELDYDLKNMKPAEFLKKYGMTRQEMLASFRQDPKPKSTQVPVSEERLEEEDKIIAVGKGHKLKPGLLNKPENSMNPTDTVKLDVPFLIRLLEYAREDANTDMDLHDLAEKLVARGVRGKTLTMKDYEFVVDESVQPGGVIAGGGVGEGTENTNDYLKVGKWVKFGMWNKPQEHKTGRIMKIGDGVVTVLIDGGPESGKMVNLNLGNKSLSIRPATEPNQGLSSVRNESVTEGIEDKIEKHNAAVAKMTKRSFADFDYKHPDLLKTAPKGYQFSTSNKLVPKEKVAEAQLDEKAVSKAQQRFMGMVHATQKGEKAPSKEVAKVAKSMKKSDAKDFAKTKHKGLPEKKKKD